MPGCAWASDPVMVFADVLEHQRPENTMTPHEVRRLEVEAELSKLRAAQDDARAKSAALEAERALLTPMFGAPSVPRTRSGIGFGMMLALAIAAALAGAAWAQVPGYGTRASIYGR